jgi:glycosyltransferase involved in cell wall biosynthesis
MFFSIVIPTRNRPTLAREALFSVMKQGFRDIEIVVSDSSTPRDAALEAHIAHLGDARIRYIAPPTTMKMGEHWAFAMADLNGEYIVVVADRWLLFPGALEKLRGQISEFDSPVISYTGPHIYRDIAPYELRRPRFTGRTYWYDSTSVAKMCSLSVFPIGLPTMANSFVRRDVFNQICITHPDVLRGSVAPDVSVGMHLLDGIDGFHYFDLPLALSRGLAENNGQLIDLGRREKAAADFASRLGNGGGLSYAPIPDLFSNHNIRIHEYLRTRHSQTSDRFINIDKQQYYRALVFEIGERDVYDERVAHMVEAYRIEHSLRASTGTRGGVRARVRSTHVKRRLEPVLNALHGFTGMNIGNRPAGRYESLDAVLADDEAHPPHPNSSRSGFFPRYSASGWSTQIVLWPVRWTVHDR